jgi:molybdopterin converting factor small subunit
MIEVRLFGTLRHYASESKATHETVIHLPADGGETVGQILAQVGIDLSQIGNVFLNGRLLPRSNYPILLGYPLAAESPLSPDGYRNTPVQAGDRLGIFPRNMGAVVV